jgi:hypothetical protein
MDRIAEVLGGAVEILLLHGRGSRFPQAHHRKRGALIQ